MNIMSLNIRGINDSHKVAWLKNLKREHCLNFCAIQESRCSSLPDGIADWWDSSEVRMEHVDAVGRSGGLISFSDCNYFKATTIIKSRHYLVTAGAWIGVRGETIVVNVYAPQSAADKKILWTNLTNLMNSRHGNWVIFGDFNGVRRSDERLNSTFCPRIAYDFNKFISEAGLIDLNMAGRRFTFFCEFGCKLSKLDRFLVNSSFLAAFPTSLVVALPRDLSDHSPIILSNQRRDFGPPPFRFYNS